MGARAVILLALVACSGPKPEVTRVAIAGAAPSGYVRVETDVVNRSNGHGQVVLEISIVNRESRAEVVAERTLQLLGEQQLHVVADVPAPPGDYDAHATVTYPD